uniref:Putative host cell surface-exposed lipoprotein n=1 Tax=Streptococcus phage TP-J34 TaxID=73422 RepID=UPI0003349071|nr:Chain A, Putative host cell surface-exposed lipoprotein [Streptococcus phage TP-J34]4EQQ_B Chain B, Putative host cell surface-exposed lipoprotein [Streptococcus phage TP-J34]
GPLGSPEFSKVPKEYRTAVSKAKQYASTVHMSKEELRSQLVSFDKYSQDASDYAVENSGIDYNKQALEKAKQYQDTLSMSPDAIRDQLVSFDKFTQEEADYAVANLK